MTTTTEGSLIRYSEGTFHLDVMYKNKMFAYHECNSGDVIDNILLTFEVRNEECGACGHIEMPDNLRALWLLFHMDGGNR
jgi:hypothetical protein